MFNSEYKLLRARVRAQVYSLGFLALLLALALALDLDLDPFPDPGPGPGAGPGSCFLSDPAGAC